MNNVEHGVSQAKDCMASLTWTERQFPTWHFSMLNDTTRNAIIENAIRELDLEGKIVFEIGAGTGLVAILFGGTVATAGYWVGQGIARILAIWPIMKFMKKV